MDGAVTSISLALILVGISYFGFILIAGFRSLRHSPSPPASAPLALRLYVLIPCLNEEAVIGSTVASLASMDVHRIVVIDDGSDDATGLIAQAQGDGRVEVRTRRFPNARAGKGAALNDGLAAVIEDVREQRLDPSSVVVCVMDADGRLSLGALAAVIPLFAAPRVGGVQLPVRIRNRQRLLTAIQDWEFWGLAALSQFARRATATVSLGGNGQFTRLSALLELDGPTWSPSLTEDLDLALRLTMAGWSITTTSDAYVDQQGVLTLRALCRQRTRWFQGHIGCSRHIPELARAPGLSSSGFQELVLYLLFPLVVMLPWSLVWLTTLPATLHLLTAPRPALVVGSAVATRAVIVGAWYLFSFAPTMVAAVAYRRRDATCGWLKAQLLAHIAFLMQPLYWWCCWRAVARIVRGVSSWDKTARVIEPSPSLVRPSLGPASGPAELPRTLASTSHGER